MTAVPRPFPPAVPHNVWVVRGQRYTAGFDTNAKITYFAPHGELDVDSALLDHVLPAHGEPVIGEVRTKYCAAVVRTTGKPAGA